MVTPPTAPRHAVCTVIYNITCSFFMFTFCGYLYIFIRTSSYKQKHNITQQYSDPLWGVYSKPGREFKHILEPKKNGDSLGRAPWRKPKNKNKETEPIGDPAIPMVMFFFLVF